MSFNLLLYSLYFLIFNGLIKFNLTIWQDYFMGEAVCFISEATWYQVIPSALTPGQITESRF